MAHLEEHSQLVAYQLGTLDSPQATSCLEERRQPSPSSAAPTEAALIRIWMSLPS